MREETGLTAQELSHAKKGLRYNKRTVPASKTAKLEKHQGANKKKRALRSDTMSQYELRKKKTDYCRMMRLRPRFRPV